MMDGGSRIRKLLSYLVIDVWFLFDILYLHILIQKKMRLENHIYLHINIPNEYGFKKSTIIYTVYVLYMHI